MDPEDRPWDGRRYLTEVQYADDANLTARQSIYAYQRPRIDLWSWALGLVDLSGRETVVDVGCGNGNYLDHLAQRGHAGPLLGLDLSAGMLASAAARTGDGRARFVNADAQALPLGDGVAGLLLATHMLYHVPERARAIAELARVAAADGTALVVTNSHAHLAEMDSLFCDAVADVTGARPALLGRNMGKFGAENAADELRVAFGRVDSHRSESTLYLTAPEPVVDYARSMSAFLTADDPDQTARVMVRIRDRAEQEIRGTGRFEVSTSVACFVCRP